MKKIFLSILAAVALFSTQTLAQTCPPDSYTVEQVLSSAKDIGARLEDNWHETTPGRSIKALQDALIKEGADEANARRMEQVLIYEVPGYLDLHAFVFSGGCTINRLWIDRDGYLKLRLQIERSQAEQGGNN